MLGLIDLIYSAIKSNQAKPNQTTVKKVISHQTPNPNTKHQTMKQFGFGLRWLDVTISFEFSQKPKTKVKVKVVLKVESVKRKKGEKKID